MPFETLIRCKEFLPHLDKPSWAVVDCRFSMQDAEQGYRDYLKAHIPGAVYAHLERDLCGQPVSTKSSRHPFPDPEALASKLSDWGIDEDAQVLVYDDYFGGFAVRLWRMLGWLGHKNVALLDGGWPRWRQLGLPIRSGEERRPRREFVARLRLELLVDANAVEEELASGNAPVIDTRSERSYTGAKAPQSPASGHIPGAQHFFFPENLDADGLLLDSQELRARYEAILQGRPAEQAIVYCTSGVTASLNILAMQHLGLGEARLYPGSWDEWSADPKRPVEKGTPRA